MQLFFAQNEEVLDQDIISNSINLESVDYNHDYSTCMLTCVHCHKHSRSISVPGIIRSGLFFTRPLIFPSLDKDDPKAIVLNSLEKALAEDEEFIERVKIQLLKLIYKYMQDKHIVSKNLTTRLKRNYLPDPEGNAKMV